MKCESCRFAQTTGLWQQAECRRHSPVGIKDRGQYVDPRYLPQWPLVTFGDWCGDYEARPQ